MTNEELYRQYLSGDTEAFEQLYLQMQGFIASVAKDSAQSCGIQKEKGQRKNPLAPMVYSRGYEVFISGICLKKLRSEQHETNLPFLKICASCEAGAGLSSQSLHFWGLILMRLGLAGGFDLFCTLESSATQSSFGICQPSMSVCSR